MNQINFRVTDEELAHLKKYCKIKERQQSEVIRELQQKIVNRWGIEPHRLTAYPSRHQPEYRYGARLRASS
ncbi:hypothetical protein J0895_25380 [Phormidium pseudopriestleyi FRX01]|uniref:CopG family transcriptional regulator n=1 Tax=Phormidium pseudopriestleyi FRX01 TaxID=1759528 RepID=A0ABS3FYZ1_9CYAN|nr:hypothetical protein [Phormidium pseudopriestleyi FRX01]